MAESTGGISVIINERSGAAGRADVGPEIQSLFSGLGARIRLERVRHPGDITARARQSAARGDVLVAAGGDGTVNAVASVAVETDSTLGVLPLGTLNHFAKDAGLPLDLPTAVRTIVDARVQPLDAGEVNGRIFVNNSSVGLYPRMLWERDLEQRRGRRKWTAFTIAMLRTWRTYRLVTARILTDGQSAAIRTPFIFIGNNEYHAEGFQLGGRARIDRAQLSIYVAPECGPFEILTLPVRAFTNRLHSGAPFAAFRSQSVTVDVSASRVDVALDGEVMTLQAPLVYRIRPGALRTLMPPPSPR